MSTARSQTAEAGLRRALGRISEAASISCAGCVALRADLTVLEQRLTALEARRVKRDPVTDDALLSALAVAFGSGVLTVRGVLASVHPEVQAAVAGLTPRQLGATLKRIHHRPTGPYRLERIGRDGDGALWALRRVSALRHTQP